MKPHVSSGGLAKRKILDRRPRRFFGIIERAVLGSAMSIALFVVERRLGRAGHRQSTRPERRTGSGEDRGT